MVEEQPAEMVAQTFDGDGLDDKALE